MMKVLKITDIVHLLIDDKGQFFAGGWLLLLSEHFAQ